MENFSLFSLHVYNSPYLKFRYKFKDDGPDSWLFCVVHITITIWFLIIQSSTFSEQKDYKVTEDRLTLTGPIMYFILFIYKIYLFIYL